MAQKKSARKAAGRKKNVKKSWAMYTYIAGDNDLSDYGIIDIEEMTMTGASPDTHVAVQIDTQGEHDGSVRYEISPPDFEGKSHRTVIQRLAEQNTGAPRYLADFAKWASSRYPANNKLLVVWNHGAGFMHEPTRDIGYDDSSRGDALTMSELRSALESAGFGKGPHARIQILGFDACLMSMLEVAYEFTDIADYLVGSQQVEPGDGWPYDKVVASLSKTATPAAVAKQIVKDYIADYKSKRETNVTQSALQVSALGALGKTVHDLGLELRKVAAGPDREKIIEARVVTQGYEEATYVDLVDLAKNLRTHVADAKVRAACLQVISAAKAAVIANGKYGGAVERSNGVSIWFPLLKTDYVTRRSEYVALRYVKEWGGWARMLDGLLAV